jgi:hypothetical protein
VIFVVCAAAPATTAQAAARARAKVRGLVMASVS